MPTSNRVRDEESSLSLLRRGEWLLCRLRGPMPLDTLQSYLGEVAGCCRAEGVRAALVDLTDTGEVVGVADQLRLGLRMGTDWPPDVPIAVLVAPHLLLPDRTFEHVASHRGVRVRSFSDGGAAAAWLAAQLVQAGTSAAGSRTMRG
jgi:hypothetical protein